MRKTLLAITLIGLSFSAFSDDECLGVIALSKTVNRFSSDSNEVQQRASAFCQEYHRSDSQGQDISASVNYKFLAAAYNQGNKSASEIASMYCASSNDGSAKNAAYSTYIESVAPQAYDAYKTCENQTSRLTIQLAGHIDNDFRMVVSNQTAGDGQPAQLLVSPSKDITCFWNNENIPSIKIVSPQTAALRCVRDDGASAKDAIVTVTNLIGKENLTLVWPGTKTRLLEKYDSLSSVVADNSRALQLLKGQVEAFHVESDVLAMAGSHKLPCTVEDGEVNKRVTFARPFLRPPLVYVGLSRVDTDVPRVRIDAERIDEKGFELSLSSWCSDRKSLTGSWIAIAR